MPPRIARVYHIQVKTHKLSIMLSSLLPSTPISEIKTEILSALQADVATDALDPLAMEPPEDFHIESVDDFELCRALRNKGQLTGEFEVLDSSKLLRETGVGGWEAIFLQPRDQNTKELLPIKYTLPSLYDDDDDTQLPSMTAPASCPTEVVDSDVANKGKGKRKASPEELEDDDDDDDIDAGLEIEVEI